jgi:hypothetical protein
MSNPLLSLPIATIEKALAIRKELEALQSSLNKILGGRNVEAVVASPVVKDGRKGKRSAATRAKMKAAQQARWAAKKGESVVAEPAIKSVKKKRTMSPEARERIAAAQRARWAKAKKA